MAIKSKTKAKSIAINMENEPNISYDLNLSRLVVQRMITLGYTMRQMKKVASKWYDNYGHIRVLEASRRTIDNAIKDCVSM